MHPVNYLFEEIYRDYWGIPRPHEPARERRGAPSRLQPRPKLHAHRQK